MPSIKFFTEDIDYKIPHPRKTSSWIKSTIQKEKKTLADLSYIFCSDEYLFGINVEYLRHKTYTDIITFDMSDGSGSIEGDIFISIQRVKENSEKLGVPFDEELHRVIIHGALHLIGYSDKTPAQKTTMRRKEDAYLSLR